MRKTGKILIGVLSVGALIGTGYASWHLNNGFAGTQTGNVGVDVNDIVINSFAEVKVTETDTPAGLKFDGDHQDLKLSYNVKAHKKEGQTNDPYDLTLYEKVAGEYIPDLQVSVKSYEKAGGKELSEVQLANLTKYITLPATQQFSYTNWLDENSKANGFNVNLEFGWSNLFENKNPQEFYKGQADKTAAEATIKDMVNTLKGVTFKVHFDVGQYTFTEVDKTGEVTIPTVANSTLAIEGMKEDGTIEAGEHAINIALDEGKQIKNNELIVVENGVNNKVTLTEAKVRATGKTYTCVYNFKKNATYSFKYEVENIPPVTNLVKEGKHDNVTFLTTANETFDFATKHEIGADVKFKVSVAQGYELKEVKLNNQVLNASEGIYTFKMAEGEQVLSATATLIPVVEKYAITVEATDGAKLVTKEGTDLDLSTKYEEGTKVEFKVAYDDSKFTLESVTLNNENLVDANGIYSVTITKANAVKVTLKAKEVVPPTPVSKTKVTFGEHANVTFLTSTGTAIDETAEYDVGSEFKFKAQVVEGFELVEVKHNETVLNAIDGIYTIKLVEGANTLVATTKAATPVETTITIAEALALNDNDPVNIKGKILDVYGNNVVVYDNTGFIELYKKGISGFAKGDVVSLKGKKSTYASSGAIQVNSPELTKLDEQLDVALPTKTTVVDATFLSKSDVELKTTHEFIEATGKLVDDGTHKNLVIEGTTNMVSIKTNDTDFVEGRFYTIKGFASGLSGGQYLNVYTTEKTLLEYTVPESVVIEDGTTLDLPEGGSKLLSTSVLPATANQEVTFEVTEGQEFATVTAEGKVDAIKMGTAKVTVKSVADSTKEAVITINVTAKAETNYIAKFDSGHTGDTYNKDSMGGLTDVTLNEMLTSWRDVNSTANIVSAKVLKLSGDTKVRVYGITKTPEHGIKFSSSSKSGAIEIKLDTQFTSVTLQVLKWDVDNSAVDVNGVKKNIETTVTETITFDLGAPTDTIKIEATERFFLYGIEFK